MWIFVDLRRMYQDQEERGGWEEPLTKFGVGGVVQALGSGKGQREEQNFSLTRQGGFVYKPRTIHLAIRVTENDV